MEIWHYSVAAFRSHPVIGIGFGNFRQFLQSHTDEKHRFLIRYNHSHCNFLEAAATTGIVGLIIFLLFWGRVGWDLFSEWRNARDPLAQAVFLALFTAFLAFHAEGLTECNLKDAEAALPFFVLLGIFYSFRKYSRAMSRKAPSAGNGPGKTEPVPLSPGKLNSD